MLHDDAMSLVRGVNLPWIGYEFCCTHAFDRVFSTLREIGFDGVVSVCVFGRHEDADNINRRMLERIQQELGV